MSCNRCARVSQPAATAVGAPAVEPAWAAGRGASGHCPTCGGWLRAHDRGCTKCERSGGLDPTTAVALETTADLAGLALAARRRLHPSEQMAILRNPQLTLVAATRLVQSAGDPVVRARALEKARSLAYGRVTEKLRGAGVPLGHGAIVRSMVWQYLDRCPRCKAWVSPRRGVCANPRCAGRGKTVAPIRSWPPVGVTWTTKAGQVGMVDGVFASPLAHVDEAGDVARRLVVAEGAAVADRCPACGAFAGPDGTCHNPLCPDRRAPPGVPGPDNGWEWARPDEAPCGTLPGDDLRKKYEIPAGATVEVIRYPSGVYELSFYDPKRPRGVWGCEQTVFIEDCEVAAVTRLAADSARSGFVQIGEEEWRRTHPVIVNPLIAAPGVNRAELERMEAGLKPPAGPEAVEAVTFKEPRRWARWDWREDHSAAKERAFLRRFPKSQLDVPRDFTYENADGSFRWEHGVMTPRQFAADRLNLWGIAGNGHHEEARRLAERCGVTLIAEEKCPLQPPRAGEGNPGYLFDYTVDGSPLVAWAMDLNKHHVVAWPGDERTHKKGWDHLPQLIGRDEFRHNRQNWAIVEMSWDAKGTSRHDDLMVNFPDWRDEKQARPAVATIAAFALRAGHDPQAAIYYEVGGEQVQTTLQEAAAGHRARPAPPARHVTEAGRALLEAVVEPYVRWRSEAPVDGTPPARRAANELSRAARRMRRALAEVGVDGLDSDLDGFIGRRDEWAGNFGRMIAEFSLLKQKVHDLFRHSPRAREVFGAGFARLFIG